MKKTLNAQLRSLKVLNTHQDFGARSVAFFAAEEAKLMAAIGHEPAPAPVRYGFGMYLEYFRASLGPVLFRSMAGAAAGVVFLLGGWMTTVHAATDSLPGDPLYGFKLISEQVQLRIASLEDRAVLHTEFAERRLEEAVALQETDGKNADSVREAFDNFKREVASASSDLLTLQNTGSANAVAAAGKVEQNLAQLDAVLDQSVAHATDPNETTVAQEAKDVSRDAQTAAVDVVVDTHESNETQEAVAEMQQMFMRKLGDLQARHAFDLHRLDAIAHALTSPDVQRSGLVLPTDADVGVLRKNVKAEAARLESAVNVYNAADYRAAFDALQSIDGELQQSETRMAQIEITITQAFTAPAPPVNSEEATSADEVPSPQITP